MAKIRIKPVEQYPIYVEADEDDTDPDIMEIEVYGPFLNLHREFVGLYMSLQEMMAMDYGRAKRKKELDDAQTEEK
jgi:hypothetical protein